MKALYFEQHGELDVVKYGDVPDPEPGPGQVLVAVRTCGVCHTELDEIEGRTAPPRLPVVPGHQAVGEVVDLGAGVSLLKRGQRVGVGWIAAACGRLAPAATMRFKATADVPAPSHLWSFSFVGSLSFQP